MPMESSTLTTSVPRIPDFHSMPKAVAAYRLSHEGRKETDNLRQQYLAQTSRHQHENQGRKVPLHLQERNAISRDMTSSAPPGFRVKNNSQRNHVVLCATHPRRMSKKTFEERARLRMKNYISKQIYKVPTHQRPEFFIKVEVEPSPLLPYPKGTISTAKCHFNYVTPKKFPEDNYKQVLGKSTTQSGEKKSKQLSNSEIKRNKIIEELISTNKPDDDKNDEGTSRQLTQQRPILPQTSMDANVVTQTPSSKSLSAILNGRHSNSNDDTYHTILGAYSMDTNGFSPTQRSKTVAFSLPSNKLLYASSNRWSNSSKEQSTDSSKSMVDPRHHFLSSPNNKQRLTSADIATAHARHHFIHPEWPSEFINWARYSHPTTSDRLRHSYI